MRMHGPYAVTKWVSEWVGFDVPPDTVYVISGVAFPGGMHTNT